MGYPRILDAAIASILLVLLGSNARQADAFGTYFDATNNLMYYWALPCRFSPVVYTLYGQVYYNDLNTMFGTYKDVAESKCCYDHKTRNRCCNYYQGGVEKCRCQLGTCATTCPVDWIKIPGTKKCYKLVVDQKRGHAQGNSYCKSVHPLAGLAQIESQAEQDFIDANVLKTHKSNVWVGISRARGTIPFLLTNKKTEIAFDNWTPGEPVRIDGNDCVLADTGSAKKWTWNNEPCGGGNHILCGMEETP